MIGIYEIVDAKGKKELLALEKILDF